MNRVLRGIGINGPSKHFLWKRWMEIVQPEFAKTIGDDSHLDAPLCRVPMDRKYGCTTSLEEVTCRACLRAMAIYVHGEEVWRRQIIRCAQVMERKRENDKPKPGRAWPV